MSTRRSTRKKRQTQLSFTPLPSSSPAASQYPDQFQQRAAAVRYDDTMSSPTKKRRVADVSTKHASSSPAASPLKSTPGRQKIQVIVNSPGNGANQLPTPMPSSQPKEQVRDSDGETPHISKSKIGSTGANIGAPIFGGKTAVYDGDSSKESTSEDDITPIRRVRRARIAPVVLSSNEESDFQQVAEPRTPKTRSPEQRQMQQLRDTPSSGTDTKVPTRRLRQKLPIVPRSMSHGRASEQSSNSSSAMNPKALKQGAGNTLVISSGVEDTTSEDEIVTPVRRRRSTVHSVTTPSKSTALEQSDSEDLDDEVADLKDTELRKSRTRGRQDTSERSKRQRKLEELRRRRIGNRHDIEEDSEEVFTNNASDSNVEDLDHVMRRGDNLDEYEDDFVDDEDNIMGVDLGVAGVPLEFTYHANKKPFEHFKTEVEWMVHNKLNPAFDRRDEIYLLAHRKLDNEVQGLGSSKFGSSVWKADFIIALKSRPDFYRLDVPTMFERKCDACQRSNHPPKHKVTFTGKPYDRDTLETIDKGEDEDDEEDSDDGEHEVGGTNSTEDEENFLLGRFCCANAEMAHALHHWRYSLNQTVLQWLANDGHLTPEKIVERENMRQKKREKAANKVVDGMETTGVMRELYLQFKQNLEAARDAKPKHLTNGR